MSAVLRRFQLSWSTRYRGPLTSLGPCSCGPVLRRKALISDADFTALRGWLSISALVSPRGRAAQFAASAKQNRSVEHGTSRTPIIALILIWTPAQRQGLATGPPHPRTDLQRAKLGEASCTRKSLHPPSAPFDLTHHPSAPPTHFAVFTRFFAYYACPHTPLPTTYNPNPPSAPLAPTPAPPERVQRVHGLRGAVGGHEGGVPGVEVAAGHVLGAGNNLG